VSDEQQNNLSPTGQSVNTGKLIREIQEFMATCAALMEQGKEPDMSGLDDQVEKLCLGIAAMDDDEADRMRPKLDTLVEELTVLGNKLEEMKESLGKQLGSLNNQKQAHNAYQRAGASADMTTKRKDDV